MIKKNITAAQADGTLVAVAHYLSRDATPHCTPARIKELGAKRTVYGSSRFYGRTAHDGIVVELAEPDGSVKMTERPIGASDGLREAIPATYVATSRQIICTWTEYVERKNAERKAYQERQEARARQHDAQAIAVDRLRRALEETDISKYAVHAGNSGEVILSVRAVEAILAK